MLYREILHSSRGLIYIPLSLTFNADDRKRQMRACEVERQKNSIARVHFSETIYIESCLQIMMLMTAAYDILHLEASRVVKK